MWIFSLTNALSAGSGGDVLLAMKNVLLPMSGLFFALTGLILLVPTFSRDDVIDLAFLLERSLRNDRARLIKDLELATRTRVRIGRVLLVLGVACIAAWLLV
jgi:hypothetical protein